MKGCSFSAGFWDDETQAAIQAGENQLPFCPDKSSFSAWEEKKTQLDCSQ